MLSAAPQDTGTTTTYGPLHEAVVLCDPDALELALGSTGQLTLSTAEGATAVVGATLCDSRADGTQLAMLSTLLAANLNVAETNAFGQGIIESVLFTASEATVRKMLAAGANPNHPTRNGFSLLATAKVLGNSGAIRALEDYGALMGTSALEQEFFAAVDDPGAVARELRALSQSEGATPDSLRSAAGALATKHWETVIPADQLAAWQDDFLSEPCATCTSESDDVTTQSGCDIACHTGYALCCWRCTFLGHPLLIALCLATCSVWYQACLDACEIAFPPEA